MAVWSSGNAPPTSIVPDNKAARVAVTSFMTFKPYDVQIANDSVAVGSLRTTDCSTQPLDSNSVDLIRHVIITGE